MAEILLHTEAHAIAILAVERYAEAYRERMNEPFPFTLDAAHASAFAAMRRLEEIEKGWTVDVEMDRYDRTFEFSVRRVTVAPPSAATHAPGDGRQP